MKSLLMRDGAIVQKGAPYNVYNAPVDRETMAFFSDVNVIQSRVSGSLADTAFGQFFAPGHADGTQVDIVFAPNMFGLILIAMAKVKSHPVPRCCCLWQCDKIAFYGKRQFGGISDGARWFHSEGDCSLCFFTPTGTAIMAHHSQDRCYIFVVKGKSQR